MLILGSNTDRYRHPDDDLQEEKIVGGRVDSSALEKHVRDRVARWMVEDAALAKRWRPDALLQRNAITLDSLGPILSGEKPTVLIVCCHCVKFQNSWYLVLQKDGYPDGAGSLVSVQRFALAVKQHNRRFGVEGIRGLVLLVCHGELFSQATLQLVEEFGVTGVASTTRKALEQNKANEYCAEFVKELVLACDFKEAATNAAIMVNDLFGFYGNTFQMYL